jgi:hypothetical protein
MKHPINTPFGPATIFYDGEDSAHLDFQGFKLGRIFADGWIIMARNDGPHWKYGTEDWRFEWSRSRLVRAGTFSEAITPGANKIVRDEVVPWLRQFLASNPNLLKNGELDRLLDRMNACTENIKDLERKLQEEREKRRELARNLHTSGYTNSVIEGFINLHPKSCTNLHHDTQILKDDE